MDALMGDIFREVRTPIVTGMKPTDPHSAIFRGVSIPHTVKYKILNINTITIFTVSKPHKNALKALFRGYSALTTPITRAYIYNMCIIPSC